MIPREATSGVGEPQRGKHINTGEGDVEETETGTLGILR